MSGQPDLLASDAERERAVGRLRRGASEGRLTVEELDVRCARAYAARTHGEREALLDDLPGGDTALQVPARRAPVDPGGFERRPFTFVFDPGGAAWGARLFVAGDPPELVGWGGFKGPPDDDGVVELGYEIAEAPRGRGLATAAARAMLAEAFADERVTTVIARALADRNASHRVLEKAGFAYEGTAQDGQAIWRFSP